MLNRFRGVLLSFQPQDPADLFEVGQKKLAITIMDSHHPTCRFNVADIGENCNYIVAITSLLWSYIKFIYPFVNHVNVCRKLYLKCNHCTA